jgi:hypothetical protein
MLMKKIYLFIIIIILAVAVVWFVKNQRVSREISAEKGLEMSVSSISQTDNFYNIQVEYPQFGDIAADFNNQISSLITVEIVRFKKIAKDNWDARIATTPPSQTVPENTAVPFDFIANWKPVQLNKEYLSFVINIYYFSGGAHGLNEVYAFNYDMVQKKEITINDFLGNLPQALQGLSQIAAQQVTSQLQLSGVEIDDVLTPMIQQGTKPTLDNYHNFNFNYNSLIIYFQQYQVAPGYVGPVTITIFKDTLDENSIMSNYLK